MIKNYNECEAEKKVIHEGEGLIDSVKLFGGEDFETDLSYVSFTRIPPGASIGYHEHLSPREEVYNIVEGTGVVTIDGEETRVKKGDVIFTPVGSLHGLVNDSEDKMDVFVFWVKK